MNRIDQTFADLGSAGRKALVIYLTAGDPETQKLLLQFMGAALSNIKGSRYKKALFMVGEGDTGKSQLKILTEKLLGHDNYAGIDLQELEARFGSSAIYGKRLAGSADMSYVTVKELKTFKLCTGGDSIFIEFKGKNAFSFIYGGLIWFCMNRLPRFGGDDGKWVFDRIMVVRCENIIPLEKQDKKLVDKMYAERDGIIYKAVMAVRETIENGHRFSEPDKVIEARNEYRTENNSVLAFINECMEKREFPGVIPSNDKSNIKTVFLVYRRWCGDNNNGFAKTFKEFKECYAGFTGVEVKNISKRTGNGMSLLEYKLTDEAISDYTNDYDFYGNIRVLE